MEKIVLGKVGYFKAMRLLGGSGACSPENFYFKLCYLVRFGEYFAKVFSPKKCKNIHFSYKNN